jgi:hypothetical protein
MQSIICNVRCNLRGTLTLLGLSNIPYYESPNGNVLIVYNPVVYIL